MQEQAQPKIIRYVDTLGFCVISPLDYLHLTTLHDQEVARILSTSTTLEYYQSRQLPGVIDHPFVEVLANGKVVQHDGRHRAAATIKSGISEFLIAVVLAQGQKSQGMPRALLSQFLHNGVGYTVPLNAEQFFPGTPQRLFYRSLR